MILREHKKHFIIVIVLISFSFGIWNQFKDKKEEESEVVAVLEEPEIAVSEEVNVPEVTYYYVDIKGAIANPGVYKIEKGSIIQDVVLIAGGLLNHAYTDNINLSKRVKDEMVIKILSNHDIDYCANLNKGEENDFVQEEVTESKLISINNGTLEELMTLTGIGEEKAKAIITYREMNGLFQTIEEIKNVSGIGEAVFEKIKSFITV